MSQPWIRPSNATNRANTEPGTRPNGASIMRSMAPGAFTESRRLVIATRNSPAGTLTRWSRQRHVARDDSGRWFAEERGHERRCAADHVIEHTVHGEVVTRSGVVELVGIEAVDDLDECRDDDGELI